MELQTVVLSKRRHDDISVTSHQYVVKAVMVTVYDVIFEEAWQTVYVMLRRI